jgi:hypothetical protein
MSFLKDYGITITDTRKLPFIESGNAADVLQRLLNLDIAVFAAPVLNQGSTDQASFIEGPVFLQVSL